LFFIVGFSLAACTAPGTTPPTSQKSKTLFTKGRSVYLSQCIACHNTDPKKDGALGPSTFGASKELLTARLLTGDYPPGYTPKRPTKIMQPLPHLKDQLDALTTFLNHSE
jgi:mono/diheme cytochrome c family protein